MKLLHITLLVAATIVLVTAQPTPPRLNIPGAIPIPARPLIRNNLPLRVRRPGLRSQTSNSIAPPIAPRIIDEPKPVTESTEDEINDPFIPQLLREQQQPQLVQQQPQYANQAPNYFNEPNSIQQDSPIEDEEPPPPRFIERPAPPPPQPQQPQNDFAGQRFAIERQQQQQPQQPRLQPVRTRASAPPREQPRPQYESQRPRASAQVPNRPIEQNVLRQDDYRPRKPVAQILRKYREENEDGSITWGYENDDGSFKEEVIGIDCITKGTYGYVDPDGTKREYHYETGIKCDPNNRNPEGQELQNSGFVNYEQNKAVLPNGLEIDLALMGKKKSKRPGAVLQQAQPQQYYRN
ncbi:RNA-binding protein 33 [Episyrphus balteatus]|uniref:RNA-binding protein 33 n=1 Tax=Episyrphus balteatus TaxID=286459 RepID=UPI002484E69D|nr:RNA-binding protein 33 [Episyrphus balteatus]